jgi:hypothetical protein
MKHLMIASLIVVLLVTPCFAGFHISVGPTPNVNYYRISGPYECLEGGLQVPARPDGGLLLDVNCVQDENLTSPVTIRACNDAGCGSHVTLDITNRVPGPPVDAKAFK